MEINEEKTISPTVGDSEEKPSDAENADGAVSERSEVSESDRRAMFYEACYRLGEADKIEELKAVEKLFLQLEDYPDCDKKLDECHEKLAELEKHKAQADAENARRLAKLKSEYTALRDDAKRYEKILKKRDAAQKLSAISEKLLKNYAEIEGAQDYAREFSAKAKSLEEQYENRRGFEKKSCIVAVLVQIAAAFLYVFAFAKIGGDFSPTVPLTVCDCIMFAGFMIGYFCESGSGAYASFFAALCFAVMLIATVILCIINKLALGLLGYLGLAALPIVIGIAAGAIVYLIWRSFAAKAEMPAEERKVKARINKK